MKLHTYSAFSFRNEDTLVKDYSVQLLVQFVNSLAIAHEDDKSIGIVTFYIY